MYGLMHKIILQFINSDKLYMVGIEGFNSPFFFFSNAVLVSECVACMAFDKLLCNLWIFILGCLSLADWDGNSSINLLME